MHLQFVLLPTLNLRKTETHFRILSKPAVVELAFSVTYVCSFLNFTADNLKKMG